MAELDLMALARMGFVLAHLLAFAASFAAVAFGDFAIFHRRRVDAELLRRAATVVSWGLAALWISGLALIWFETRMDLAVLAGKPKLLAKLAVVSVLTLNGFALHSWAFPRLLRPQRRPQAAASGLAVLGAISATTWIYAAFVGVGKDLAPALGFVGFMALYAAALALGVGVALVFVRPRLAARLRPLAQAQPAPAAPA